MIRAVDLFAGAGGASEGLIEAATLRGEQVQLVAVNHWPTAVQTHTVNHPSARHYCQPIESVDPREAVPGGKLDLLMAAPECTHHSTARGGRPINDQSRAGAWQILRWLDLLDVKHLLIENVPEFRTWGPLNGHNRPIQAKKGETFRAFISAIESYGFNVEYRVLNAADYGAATTRRRLFIQARKGGKRIHWPDATHSKTGSPTLFGGTKKWRAAREVIDWSLAGESIFRRKKALAPATMRRILEGLRRFGGQQLEPFIVVLRNHMDGQSIDGPLPTVTGANRGELAIVEPMILPQGGGGVARPIAQPVPTVHGDGIGLIEPFIITPGGANLPNGRSTADPLPTVTTSDRFGVVSPFMTEYYGNGGARPISEPVPTLTTKDRLALIQPVVNGYTLDIRFRMLKPHELAAAMSFPNNYTFTGNKGEQVKQIGNAWDVSMGRALCGAILDGRATSKPAKVEKIA